ncbi:MAG: hypothetical protein HZB55_23825 [Deltaproteobacteria bacterium]|nr:hypothetical protein [Deltaproteobacteria bacterium]
MVQGYPVAARIEGRWTEVDALDHVVNAACVPYLETARTLCLERVFDVRRRRAATHHEVGVRIPLVVTTHFEYELRSAPGAGPVARACQL